MDDQPTIIKRGRKRFSTDTEEIVRSTKPISFAPSLMTREHIAYCMRETGMYNKSALISLAFKNFNDMLVAEARRRQSIEDDAAMRTINANNFKPLKK
jgi:hypothetical protein